MADGKPQIWDIPLTPAQRFILAQFALLQAEQVDGDEGKKLRRALRAFGLMPIRDSWKTQDGPSNSWRVPSALANGTTPALHKITIENLEVALSKWSKVKRQALVDLDIGDVFDMLEDIKARPDEWTAPELPPYVPEDWTPPVVAPPTLPIAPEGPLTCPSCKATFDLAEAQPTKGTP